MSEHKAWYRNPEKQGWYAGCACDWQSVDMRQGSRGVVFATEADARAAYADHVYSAVGREAVEHLRLVVNELICYDFDGSGQHYCGRCDNIVDRNRVVENPARTLLAAVDEALRGAT